MSHKITVGEELRTDVALAAVSRKVVTLSTVSGNIAVAAGAFRWYNDTGADLTVVSTRASLGTAPTTTSAIVDINLNGTTIFTTQGSRPTILATTNTAQGATPDVTTIPSGSYMTADVDQIGSGTAGANLTVQVVLAPASL